MWLIRYRPYDVYYSTSCWLVPENLGRRERTPVSDNIFLSSDIVFDIDRPPFSFSTLDQARDINQGVRAGTPTYLMTIHAPDRNNEHFVSLPHCRFFSGCGTPVCQYRRQHGTGDVFLTHTVIERG